MKKKIISSIVVSGFLVGVFSVFALSSEQQVTATSGYSQVQCVTLKSDALRYRATDATTRGEVTVLQNFLVSNSYLKGSVTGYFGAGTHGAVKLFQKSAGISQTGFVGILTKAKINEKMCPSSTTTRSTPLPPVAQNKVACTMEVKLCPNGTVVPRDPLTCQWLDAKCSSSTSSSAPDVVTQPVPSNQEQQRQYVCDKKKIVCAQGTSTYNSFSCSEVTRMCEQMSGAVPKVSVPETMPVINKTLIVSTGTVSSDNPPVLYPSDPILPTKPLICPARALVMCPGGSAPRQVPGTCQFTCPGIVIVPASTTVPVIPKKFPGEVVCKDVIRYCPAGVIPKTNDPCSCIVNTSAI